MKDSVWVMGRGNASGRVIAFRRQQPRPDAPVRAWVAWFTRYAELWDVVAQETTLTAVASDAAWMADYQRRLAKQVQESYQPDDVWPDALRW